MPGRTKAIQEALRVAEAVQPLLQEGTSFGQRFAALLINLRLAVCLLQFMTCQLLRLDWADKQTDRSEILPWKWAQLLSALSAEGLDVAPRLRSGLCLVALCSSDRSKAGWTNADQFVAPASVKP